MKIFAILLFLVANVATQAADVVFLFSDSVGSKKTTTLTLTPTGGRYTPDGLTLRSEIVIQQIKTGTYTVSNLFGGSNFFYAVSINDGSKQVSQYTILVPDTNAVLYAHRLVVSTPGSGGVYGYSTLAADSKFATKAEIQNIGASITNLNGASIRDSTILTNSFAASTIAWLKSLTNNFTTVSDAATIASSTFSNKTTALTQQVLTNTTQSGAQKSLGIVQDSQSSMLMTNNTGLIQMAAPQLTISGWGYPVGAKPDFRRIRILCNTADASYLPSEATVRVRSGNGSGAILGSTTVSLSTTLGVQFWIDATFPQVISSTNGALWVEYNSNGRLFSYWTATNAFASPTTVFWTTRDTANFSVAASGTSSAQYLFYTEFWSDVASGPQSLTQGIAYAVDSSSAIRAIGTPVYSFNPTYSLGTLSVAANAAFSIFSGWGEHIGNITNRFDNVQLSVYAFDSGHIPTKLLLNLRQMPSNTNLWTQASTNWPIVDTSEEFPVQLSASTVTSLTIPVKGLASGNLWLELVSDGYVSMMKSTEVVSDNPYYVRYITGSSLINPVFVHGSPSTAAYYIPVVLGTNSGRAIDFTPSAAFKAKLGSQTNVSVSALPTVSIQLPTSSSNSIYALEGRELNIYWRNIIRASVPLDMLNISVTCTKGKIMARQWRYTPTAGDAGTTTFTLTISTLDGTLIKSATSTLITRALAYPVTPVSRKLLVIGDSTTGTGMSPLAELVALFIGDSNYTLTEVGSNTGSAVDASQTGRTIRCDAISGWSMTGLCTDTNTAWTQLDGTPRTGSPFVYGGVFNFSTYLTTYGITLSSGDWVILNVGINDVFQAQSDAALQTSITTGLGYLTTMITSIKAAVPGIRIGVSLTIPPTESIDGFGTAYGSAYYLWRYRRNNDTWVETVLANYDTQLVNNVFIVPLRVNLDCLNNYPQISIPLNSRNTNTFSISSNGVHPGLYGYAQIADVYRMFLKGIE